MRYHWSILLLLSLVCSGCSKSPPAETSNDTKKKPRSSSTSNYRAPGPASAKRAEFNSKGKESLSSNSGVDELFIKDLDSSNLDSVKQAIEHLQGNKVKSALPKLESLAKNHKNADIKKRAQNAVNSMKK